MSKLYYINDTEFNPIDNATLYTREQFIGFGSCVVIISFYDAAGALVTPTAGTVLVEASPIAGQYLGPSAGDALITCTEVIAGSATYSMPVFIGPIRRGRVTLANVTGATQFSAYFWRQ